MYCTQHLYPDPALLPIFTNGVIELTNAQCTTLIGDQADAAKKAIEIPRD